ncbi:MAG: HlyD family efflux transporter periplasmic adaptor subunit [Candidatus Hydrogenedentes bacterium]|nr:HlyD family efflux transporter periplasmic adaptor subunit [Candidatus Hydrogenedentota bacterium]
MAVSGQIEGTAVAAGSLLGGRVAAVPVREGDRVAQGALLVRLESTEQEAHVAAALAQLAQAEALYSKLRNGARPETLRQSEAAALQAEEQYRMLERGSRVEQVEAARARAATLRAQLDKAGEDRDRMEQLRSEEVVSQQRLDDARHAFDAAASAFDAAQEELAMLTKGARVEEINMARAAHAQAQAVLEELEAGARYEDLLAAQAGVDAARADAALSQKALREMEIVSPLEGVIESLDVHPGDIVKPGPIAQITDPDDLEVVVYVSAALLGGLVVGEEVPFTADSFGEEIFTGRIIQVATVGEYTPRNLQTVEERVQQVFGIKLALDSSGGRLKAGMTVTAAFGPAGDGAP